MPLKRTKLDIEFSYEFWLFGLSSSAKFFKLAWAINKHLGLQLIRQKDHKIVNRDSEDSYYGIYNWICETGCIELFKNKSMEGKAGYLIPEFSHFDYFVKIDCSLQSFSREEILKELKDVPWIEYIAGLEVIDLKSIDNYLS